MNSFHFSDAGSWRYELYECGLAGNDYVDVQIPDVGPFAPKSADRVTLTGHGDWLIPWPVFRYFQASIEASGDIADGASAPAGS